MDNQKKRIAYNNAAFSFLTQARSDYSKYLYVLRQIKNKDNVLFSSAIDASVKSQTNDSGSISIEIFTRCIMDVLISIMNSLDNAFSALDVSLEGDSRIDVIMDDSNINSICGFIKQIDTNVSQHLRNIIIVTPLSAKIIDTYNSTKKCKFIDLRYDGVKSALSIIGFVEKNNESIID